MAGSPTDFQAISDALTEAGSQLLPGRLGLEIMEIGEGRARMRCEIRSHHLAPNGYLHAGTIVTLADTAAGYGTMGNLPEGASGFTTIELKTNFLGTVLEGTLVAEATMLHGGRTTQVWDVDVSVEATGKMVAIFRCTQFVLYAPT